MPNGNTIVNIQYSISPFDLAVAEGFTGTLEEWLESLRGMSAFDVAVSEGFIGTEAEWLASLEGSPGGDVFFGTEVFGNTSNETFAYRECTFLQATSEPALLDLNKNSDRESEVFLTQDHAAGVYVRNPNRILPEVDLTGMSPWNSNGNGVVRAGTLITPKHIGLANHFNVPNGTTMRFVAQDGTVHERVTVDSENIFRDLQVSTLDADLPSTIKPFKVLPENWRNFTDDQFFDFHVIFATDNEEKLITKRMNQSLLANGNISAVNHTLPPFSEYTESVETGDSGNPIFFIINGQPVYVSQWFGVTSGTPIYPHYAAVEAYIGPDYSLDFIDLSGFVEF